MVLALVGAVFAGLLDQPLLRAAIERLTGDDHLAAAPLRADQHAAPAVPPTAIAAVEATSDLPAEPPPVVPVFDIIRVEPNGDAVIAGQAEPEAAIEIVSDTVVVAATKASARGEWAVVLAEPLTPGPHDLAVRAVPAGGGDPVYSEQRVAVSIDPLGRSEPLVVVSAPGAASSILQAPAAPALAAADAGPPLPGSAGPGITIAGAEAPPGFGAPRRDEAEAAASAGAEDPNGAGVVEIEIAAAAGGDNAGAGAAAATVAPGIAAAATAGDAGALATVNAAPATGTAPVGQAMPDGNDAGPDAAEPGRDADRVAVAGPEDTTATVPDDVAGPELGNGAVEAPENGTVPEPRIRADGQVEAATAPVATSGPDPQGGAAEGGFTTAPTGPGPAATVAGGAPDAAATDDPAPPTGPPPQAGAAAGGDAAVNTAAPQAGGTDPSPLGTAPAEQGTGQARVIADEPGEPASAGPRETPPAARADGAVADAGAAGLDAPAAALPGSGAALPAGDTPAEATDDAAPPDAAPSETSDAVAPETLRATPPAAPAAAPQPDVAPAPIAEPPLPEPPAVTGAIIGTQTGGGVGVAATAGGGPADPPVGGEANAAGAPGAGATTTAHVVVQAVEVEGEAMLYVAGAADPGARVRVYIDNVFRGEAQADANGRWLLEAPGGVAVGQRTVRADQIGTAAGEVVARSEVPFQRLADAEVLVPVTGTGGATGGGAGGDEVAVAVPPPQSVIIRSGDNLWTIARRLYGRGVRYSTIYGANTDQIRDPDLIYPGQVFVVPEGDLGWEELN